jgi:hypothetical protein
MKIARADERQWQRFASHRKGLLQNKRLLSGTEGLPDNYELSIVDVAGDYETPPHRHNFDQIRFQLVGSFGYGEADEMCRRKGQSDTFRKVRHMPNVASAIAARFSSSSAATAALGS